MTEICIECPECGVGIPLTEAIASPLIEEKERAFKTQQQALRKQWDSRLAVLEEREKVADRVDQEIQARVTTELSKHREREDRKTADLIEQGNLRVRKAEEMELAARKARAAAEKERQSLELKIQREVDSRLQTEREGAARQADEESHAKLAAKDKMLADLRKQIDLLQRKGTSGSQQMQGDLCEVRVAMALTGHFADDTITRVKTGARGADILQTVNMSSGRSAGAVLIEVKDTANWQNQWLVKVREDQRTAEASVSVIVSRSLPPRIQQFGCIEGVWVCDEKSLLPLVQSLRHGMLDLARERLLSAVTHDTSAIAFRYLTGESFRNRVCAMVECYSALRTDLDKEKRALTRTWQRREKLLDRLLGGIDGVHADLSAIVGPGLGAIEGLDGIDTLGVESVTSLTDAGGLENDLKNG